MSKTLTCGQMVDAAFANKGASFRRKGAAKSVHYSPHHKALMRRGLSDNPVKFAPNTEDLAAAWEQVYTLGGNQ